MPTFEHLPLEIRSTILQHYLADFFTRHSMSSELHWDNVETHWELRAPMRCRYVAISKARSALIRRRNTAAVELLTLQHAFHLGSSSTLESQRLARIELARLKDAGRAACLQAGSLRSAYQNFQAHGSTEARDMFSSKWGLVLRDLSELEWTCNVIEMGLGVEKGGWTRLRVQQLDLEAVWMSVLDFTTSP